MLYRFAGLCVDMEPIYDLLRDRAAKYRVEDGEPDLVLRLPARGIPECHAANPNLTEAECEYLLVGTLFYHRLVDFDGIMIHASAVARGGRAYLFSADSGTGKSTHTALWLRAFDDAYLINDDKPAVRLVDGVPFCFGTPFSGKHDLSRNEAVPLGGIAFLDRAETNRIEPLDAASALPYLMRQTLRAFPAERLARFGAVMDALLRQTPAWHLFCNREPTPRVSLTRRCGADRE